MKFVIAFCVDLELPFTSLNTHSRSYHKERLSINFYLVESFINDVCDITLQVLNLKC